MTDPWADVRELFCDPNNTPESMTGMKIRSLVIDADALLAVVRAVRHQQEIEDAPDWADGLETHRESICNAENQVDKALAALPEHLKHDARQITDDDIERNREFEEGLP